MKFSTATLQEPQERAASQQITFPAGLVGFPEFTKAEIVYQPDQLPFMWLKSTEGDKLHFLVVEPVGLVPAYEIEVTDPDVDALKLSGASDALILNIATLHKNQGTKITLNLIGPIVINRRTLEARQVIIGNSQKYSARHLLFEDKA
jgi:flagellar assembly factor FliW